MHFLNVDTLETAHEKLFDCAKGWLITTETVKIEKSLNRILSDDIFTSDNIPHFQRSTVDGYAVTSKDVAAASDTIPVYLKVVGQIEMGQASEISIRAGECVEVSTGGMLPDGADAVVMVEYTETFTVDEIAIYSGVSNGENVVQVGEDIKSGELLLSRGRRIQPQDIGSLSAVGVTEISVYTCPKISIISTGDELILPDKIPRVGQMRDVNTNLLTSKALKCGFEIINSIVIPDDRAKLELFIIDAMKKSDIVIVSGGSSKGKKDLTCDVFSNLAKPGVFTHGLAVKPGKPTILGYDDSSKTILIGLPGHPIAALMVFELILSHLLQDITGSTPLPAIPAKISCNVASNPGRLSCFPARLIWTGEGYKAEPIFSKSGLITALVNADGYFLIERNLEGLTEGQYVQVYPL